MTGIIFGQAMADNQPGGGPGMAGGNAAETILKGVNPLNVNAVTTGYQKTCILKTTGLQVIDPDKRRIADRQSVAIVVGFPAGTFHPEIVNVQAGTAVKPDSCSIASVDGSFPLPIRRYHNPLARDTGYAVQNQRAGEGLPSFEKELVARFQSDFVNPVNGFPGSFE
jgi:hypothetical protein